ncbi:10 kDa chaperonin 5 [mine drainage metagenome]|uniref:10 kDa chaperonin 5 n=1 Tax=mine drainage metagenome TaxID=410659 RepID=A0A1J5PKC2_9ZZZZ
MTSELTEKLPIRMLHDRVLVSTESGEGERKSTGGILIPATASIAKRLAWAGVVATGPQVRTVEVGDRVLFDPEERGEVEIQSKAYVLLKERDIHAIASPRLDGAQSTGLYL